MEASSITTYNYLHTEVALEVQDTKCVQER